MSFSQRKLQPLPVCTWSVHAPQSELSTLPFPQHSHTLTPTSTPTLTAASELLLFGGFVHRCASRDLYVFSTRDFSATLLQTKGEVPSPRYAHGATLIGTTLLICGGKTNYVDQDVPSHDSLYLLNLVSREWTRVVVNGPGPGRRDHNTINVVGSKLFVFGGQVSGKAINDMWTLDLTCLKSRPLWESYEPTSGKEKPLPRAGHVSVTTGDRIIIFGGTGDRHYYNDTWSFDISTRKWTELQCTGSPSPRASHAAVLVDDVMYVFGGFSRDEGYLDDLYALQLPTQRWFKFHNVGPSPLGRLAHAMASDGTHVFVLGGHSEGALAEEMSLIHVFDTKDIKYPEPERNAVNPNKKATQLARKSSTSPLAEEQPQHRKYSSPEAHRIHGQNHGPNDQPLEFTGVNSRPRRSPEDDASEGSAEYRTECTAPHSSSEITRLESERQLSAPLAVQTERDHRIAQLTDEFALKSALLEQAEANAVEAARRAGPELGEYTDDRRLTRTSLMKQRDVEPVDMQASLNDMQVILDELLLSHDQEIGQYEKELANVRAKLEANESELEAVRLRLTEAEKGLE